MVEAGAAAAAGAGGMGAAAAAAGVGEWLRAFDSVTSQHYWYNSVTLEAAWELPTGAKIHESVSA